MTRHGSGRQVADHVWTGRSAKAGKVAALLALVAVTVTGCSGAEILRFGWPEGITADAERMRTLWTWSVVAALAVGVIVWGLIFWTVVFHRKKKPSAEDEATGAAGDEVAAEALPRQFQYNVSLELFCVVVPIIMVCVLFFFTVTTGQKVMAEEKNPDVTVEVVAFSRTGSSATSAGRRPRRARSSARSARPTGSRCSCCPPTRRSSTSCAPPM